MAAKTLSTLLRQLQGKHHAHGCHRCPNRYTDACQSTDEDGLCQECRGSTHGRPMWDVSSDPALCCYEYSKEATIEQRVSYQLAGLRTWYKCQVCARTHPVKPSKHPVEA